MSPVDSLRFRLFLGLAKRIIFVADSIPIRFDLLTHPTGPRRIEIPDIGHAVSIPCQCGPLGGWYAAPQGPIAAAVLVFHGIGDRPHYWRGAQRRLAQSGIASLVFAYPGYPGSCGTTTPANLDRGAHSAYDWLREHVPVNTPVFLLGFSLGTGLAADVAGELSPAPAGIILAEAFTSLREAAGRVARPAPFLARVLPDVWKTRENVARLKIPLLIIHSTGDALFPVAMAEQLFAAAKASGAPAQLEVLEGLAHNSPYLTVPEDYWQAIRQFIARNSHSAEPLTTTNLRNSPP